jgi:hypothetical protein
VVPGLERLGYHQSVAYATPGITLVQFVDHFAKGPVTFPPTFQLLTLNAGFLLF